MGMWDFEAWDNDSAADWFGGLMDASQLREHWLRGIEADSEGDFEVARAAVWLFRVLGRVYVWPIENYDNDLELAISKGEAILKVEWLQGEAPEFLRHLKADLDELKSRRKKRPSD